MVQPEERHEADAEALCEGADAPDDLALIAAIVKKDPEAIALFYDRYAAVVYRLALRVLGKHELAEDLVQEAFWRVWQRSASFDRQRGRVVQWLLGIVHNLCIDELRRRRARPAPVYADDRHPILHQLHDEWADVPAAAWAAEQRRCIREALPLLPKAQRQAIELAYFDGLSHREIAAKLNRPPGTIKTRLRLGLQKLGALLAAKGWQAGDAW
jgi:RNA polymerase sigma-70 factor (ECF subfamily)